MGIYRIASPVGIGGNLSHRIAGWESVGIYRIASPVEIGRNIVASPVEIGGNLSRRIADGNIAGDAAHSALITTNLKG